MNKEQVKKEQELYEAAMCLYEDVMGFVEEEVKLFGLRKHKKKRWALLDKILKIRKGRDIFAGWPLSSSAYEDFEGSNDIFDAYTSFFSRAAKVVILTYEMDVCDSKIFMTKKRKEKCEKTFLQACAANSAFGQAKQELNKQRALNLIASEIE